MNYRDLYTAEAPRMWRAIAAFSRDTDIASDAVAEAFAQCIARGGEVRHPREWIWKAAFRIAAGLLKERGRFDHRVPELAHFDRHDVDTLSILSSLPPNQRAALILRYYVDYDTGQIADVLGCGTATVRVHLSRGRRAVARRMKFT
jgi:RNA polymerase sigma-70 factor (ECF subfamily)